MRLKWFRVDIHGQLNCVAVRSRTWSAAVLQVLIERHPTGEIDEWSRKLDPEANLWQCLLRVSPTRAFAVSGFCREMTESEVALMFKASESSSSSPERKSAA